LIYERSFIFEIGRSKKWQKKPKKTLPCIFVVNIDFMLLKKALVMIVMKRLNYNPRIEK